MADCSTNDEMTVKAADTAAPRGRGRGRGRPQSRAGYAIVTNQGTGQVAALLKTSRSYHHP